VQPLLQPQTIASSVLQASADTTLLDTLLQRALAVNPQLRAARARVTAARARIGPAATRPDPMLMVGVQNFPAREPGFSDFMTMKMVGISQTFPYRGKLGLQRRVAEHESDGASATLVDATRQTIYDVRAAYYELAFLDHAFRIIQRNQTLLNDLIRVTEIRYRAGNAAQADVLKARVEATRLAATAVTLTTQRRAVLARLNAVLDRPSDTPVDHPTLPSAIIRAVTIDSTQALQFMSPALGSLAARSPFPSLDSLQMLALQQSAGLQVHSAMMDAQRARVTLARKAALPDVNVALQYGQRQVQSDMVTAVVSFPLPLHRHTNQEALTASAQADLLALEAEHTGMQNALRTRVTQLYTTAERMRTQLALYAKATLPQSQAAWASATAAYQVGRADLLTVLDHQITLFTTETDYLRVLTDFAITVAELDQIIGQEVLP
jgi:outer membrane protein TolC